MTVFGVSLARVGRSPAGARIAAAGKAFQDQQLRAATANASPPKPLPTDTEAHHTSCRGIIREVAKAHGITAADILSRTRSRTIGAARTEAMYRCVAETEHSLPAIGRVFDRDHTTVGAAVVRHHVKTGQPLPRGMTVAGYEDKRLRGRRRR